MKIFKVRASWNGMTVVFHILAEDFMAATKSAKVKAHLFLGGDADKLTLEDKTKPEDVKIDFPLLERAGVSRGGLDGE